MISYLFISGFLGAGKTTLLNNLLRRYSHLKIGVIVNDFGDLAVDNMLIDKEAVAGEVLELRAGQIFCSCLSGKFVESVLAYKDIQPDLLLVECSGLAKPATLADIVKVIDKKAPDSFDYAGMIALIDATRHTVLEQSLGVVTEQIEASDILLVSKADSLEKEESSELYTHLNKQYPDKTILQVAKSGIDQDLIELLQTRTKAFNRIDAAKHAGWGEHGRPVTFTIKPPLQSLRETIERLQPFQERWYRLKGTLPTLDRGFQYFDGIQGNVTTWNSDEVEECGVVVITHDGSLENELKTALSIKPTGLQPLNIAM